jgi:hypothetical protein
MIPVRRTFMEEMARHRIHRKPRRRRVTGATVSDYYGWV